MTGATGLVGAHTAMALLDAGHSLRLLVREPALARAYFESRGYAVDDLVAADMRDAAAVDRAMAGCDAVLHAAAMVNLDPRRASEVYRVNLAGIDTVVGGACRLGVPNIVHVSSLGALFRPGAACIDEHSPLGEPQQAYSRSKRDGDALVRRLQEQGYPVQISYPGGVFGPDDPRLSESNHAVVTFLRAMVPRTTTGIQCVDARDVALAHRCLLEHPYRGPATEARYILGGHYYPWDAFHGLLHGLTGRRILSPVVPGWLFRLLGVLADAVRRVYPFTFPMSSESMAIVTRWTPADSGKIERDFGLAFRPSEHTFAATIRWLVAAGHLPARYAGQLLH